MKRMRLENIANETKTLDDIKKYKEQRNLVVKKNIRAERQFYASLDPTVVGKAKHFWETFKSLFSEQSNLK